MGIAERREREKQMRRRQILDAAREIFSAKGFNGSTVEEIADRAELSPATLYLYFKNKYDLYATLNLEILQRVVDNVEKFKDDPQKGVMDKIRGFSDALYEVYEYDPLILINFLHLQSSDNLTEMSPELMEETRDLAAKGLRTMAELFKHAIEDGMIDDYPPVALADMTWALFTGLVLWEEGKRFYNPDKKFLKPTLEMAVEIMTKGIRKSTE